MEQLSATLENIPLEDLANGALRAVQGFDRFISAPELMNSVRGLDRTMTNLANLTQEVAEVTLATDYLERHPEAILVGKGKGRG